MATQDKEQSYWHHHVSQCMQSDVTQKAYCKQHDLPLKLFQKWRYQFRDEFPVIASHSHRGKLAHKQQPENPAFIPVQVKPSAPSKQTISSTLKLHISATSYFEVPIDASEAVLQRLFRVARSQSC